MYERKSKQNGQDKSIEIRVDEDVKFREARCRFCHTGSTEKDYLTLMPVTDLVLGKIEVPYHPRCYAEEHKMGCAKPGPAQVEQAKNFVKDFNIRKETDIDLETVLKGVLISVLPFSEDCGQKVKDKYKTKASQIFQKDESFFSEWDKYNDLLHWAVCFSWLLR